MLLFFAGLNDFTSVGRVQRVKGDIKETKIVDVAGQADCSLALSEDGQLFAWGNSEYGQLSMVTDHTQVNVPRYLPVHSCGTVVKAAAGGSICALLNGNSSTITRTSTKILLAVLVVSTVVTIPNYVFL